MTERTRRLVFLSLGIALMSLLLLSVSLPNLQLTAGQPFPGSSGGGAAAPEPQAFNQAGHGSLPVLAAVLVVLMAIVVLSVPARLLRLVKWKHALRLLIAAALLILLISILPRVPAGSPIRLPDESASSKVPSSESYPVSPLGDAPPTFLWIAAAGVLMAVGFIGVALWRQQRGAVSAKEALSQKAEGALRELASGMDFHGVIVRCYLEMLDVLHAERGMEREGSATVREFQDWLERNGVPADPVHRLTSLFEKARYSAEPMAPGDEQAGKECLEQIVRYCRQGARNNG